MFPCMKAKFTNEWQYNMDLYSISYQHIFWTFMLSCWTILKKDIFNQCVSIQNHPRVVTLLPIDNHIYTCLLGVGVSLFKHNIQFLWMHCQCIKWMPSLCKQINVPSLSLWLTNFRRIYVYYLLQCLYLWEIWTVESSFFPSSTFHTCTVWFVIHILSQFNSCFYFSVHVLYDILFCILCCDQGRMKGMLFENLDHYFTNLFLQIYEIVHIYISLLKSIKSVDTKMFTEEYSESYATMY